MWKCGGILGETVKAYKTELKLTSAIMSSYGMCFGKAVLPHSVCVITFNWMDKQFETLDYVVKS